MQPCQPASSFRLGLSFCTFVRVSIWLVLGLAWSSLPIAALAVASLVAVFLTARQISPPFDLGLLLSGLAGLGFLAMTQFDGGLYVAVGLSVLLVAATAALTPALPFGNKTPTVLVLPLMLGWAVQLVGVGTLSLFTVGMLLVLLSVLAMFTPETTKQQTV